jgi:hypothetical protein
VIAANEYLGEQGYIEEAYAIRGSTGDLFYTALSSMDWLEYPPEELGVASMLKPCIHQRRRSGFLRTSPVRGSPKFGKGAC